MSEIIKSNTIVGGKIHEYISKTYQKIKDGYGGNSMYIIIMLTIFIVLILSVSLIYLYYMMNLESSECSRLDSLYSTINPSLHNINLADPSFTDAKLNYKFTFKDYYIKTAFNCCSGGKYKNDFVDLCVLKSLLKAGVRGLDCEIYSVGDQPVVATSTDSNYNIKETYNSVKFSDVMTTVMNYAFSNSTAPNPNDPIIFHLRIKSSNQTMFNNLAAVFQANSWRLLGPEYGNENQICNNETGACVSSNLGDMSLHDLQGKIILIVDRSNTDFMDNTEFYAFVNMTSNSMFMRCLNYYNAQYTPDMTELQEYNKRNMTIVIPDNNTNPENPSGIICRELGCQMIAMRYEKTDDMLTESDTFFNTAGYAFVLKPENLRYIPVFIVDTPPNDPLLNYDTRTTTADYYSFNT